MCPSCISSHPAAQRDETLGEVVEVELKLCSVKGERQSLTPKLPASPVGLKSPSTKASPGIFCLPVDICQVQQQLQRKPKAGGPCTARHEHSSPGTAGAGQCQPWRPRCCLPPGQAPGQMAVAETSVLASRAGSALQGGTVCPPPRAQPGCPRRDGHPHGSTFTWAPQHLTGGLWEKPHITDLRKAKTGPVCRAQSAGFPAAQPIFPMAHARP